MIPTIGLMIAIIGFMIGAHVIARAAANGFDNVQGGTASTVAILVCLLGMIGLIVLGADLFIAGVSGPAGLDSMSSMLE